MEEIDRSRPFSSELCLSFNSFGCVKGSWFLDRGLLKGDIHLSRWAIVRRCRSDSVLLLFCEGAGTETCAGRREGSARVC